MTPQGNPETAERGHTRYRVERTGHGFWPYCVRAGDGKREILTGHRKQMARAAAELNTAFLDGVFVGGEERDAALRDLQAAREREQFTDEELGFIATELYASLSNGAEHPLFEQCYQKAKSLRAALRTGKVGP